VRKVFYTNRFKRDFKRVRKRGFETAKITNVIELLANDIELPARCRPHKLSGKFTGYWECHVESDWLLIYMYGDGILDIAATGSHADLFK